MKSIRWIRQVLIDEQPATLEIMIGVDNIADRCYVRINQDPEHWFTPLSDHRDSIIEQGTGILRKLLQNHSVTAPDGSPFTWK